MVSAPQAQVTTSGDIFHLFPELPTEIRLNIWESSFPGPRVHEISLTKPSSWCLTRRSRPTPNFTPFAAKEAYNLFLRKWFRVDPLPVPGVIVCGPPVVYFNPEIDTLYICDSNDSVRYFAHLGLDALNIKGLSHSVRVLAYGVCHWYQGLGSPQGGVRKEEYEHRYAMEFFSYFPKVELFIIVANDICTPWRVEESIPTGIIQFVDPIQLYAEGERDFALTLQGMLASASKAQDKTNIPDSKVQEVLRGGTRMTVMTGEEVAQRLFSSTAPTSHSPTPRQQRDD